MAPRPRIVVLADSLSLPRDDPGERVLWEETWPSVLEAELEEVGRPAQVINCGVRTRTSDRIVDGEMDEHVRLKRPRVVLVQVGVVDCAPRIFSRNQKRLLNLPVVPARLRETIVKLRSARRAEITGRDPLARVYTRPDDYERDFRRFVDQVRSLPEPAAIILLPILRDPGRMEAKSPGHGGNVDLYNDRLRAVARDTAARFVEPAGALPGVDHAAAFVSDGYHLSVAGNRALGLHLAPLVAALVGPTGS